ncbi:hypothetical protein HDE_12723 [Halotydeus destructor]|nr:hypothetical protein HDE_12723 [Halotydeus destructor]
MQVIATRFSSHLTEIIVNLLDKDWLCYELPLHHPQIFPIQTMVASAELSSTFSLFQTGLKGSANNFYRALVANLIWKKNWLIKRKTEIEVAYDDMRDVFDHFKSNRETAVPLLKEELKIIKLIKISVSDRFETLSLLSEMKDWFSGLETVFIEFQCIPSQSAIDTINSLDASNSYIKIEIKSYLVQHVFNKLDHRISSICDKNPVHHQLWPFIENLSIFPKLENISLHPNEGFRTLVLSIPDTVKSLHVNLLTHCLEHVTPSLSETGPKFTSLKLVTAEANAINALIEVVKSCPNLDSLTLDCSQVRQLLHDGTKMTQQLDCAIRSSNSKLKILESSMSYPFDISILTTIFQHCKTLEHLHITVLCEDDTHKDKTFWNQLRKMPKLVSAEIKVKRKSRNVDHLGQPFNALERLNGIFFANGILYFEKAI